MSELIINLDTATPLVLRSAIKMCQELLGEQDKISCPSCHNVHVDDGKVPLTDIHRSNLDNLNSAAVNTWTEEAQHIQQEHVDSLNVRMESREAGSPVGTVTTFNPPGLPAEFTLVQQRPVTNGLPAEFTPGTAATQQPGIELDSAGLPWDSRIHSSNKTKLANGTWRPKKGVDASVQTKVVKQIANEVTHVPPAPPAGTGMTWEILLQRIVAATQSGRINVVEFNQWLLDRNVQGGVAMLSLRNDLWNDVINTFGV